MLPPARPCPGNTGGVAADAFQALAASCISPTDVSQCRDSWPFELEPRSVGSTPTPLPRPDFSFA